MTCEKRLKELCLAWRRLWGGPLSSLTVPMRRLLGIWSQALYWDTKQENDRQSSFETWQTAVEYNEKVFRVRTAGRLNRAQREGESPSLPAWKTWLDKSQAAWSECSVNSALSGWTRNTLKFLLATVTACSADLLLKALRNALLTNLCSWGTSTSLV